MSVQTNERSDVLTTWREGDEGVVVSVDPGTRFGVRLQELGALPDARIRLLRRGSPSVIQIEDGRFCVRREDIELIRVRRANGGATSA